MPSFLVVQTAFIGDAILATAVIEKLHKYFPDDTIDLLVRKGNESLFSHHPHLSKVYVWDKTKKKYKNLITLIRAIRASSYDHVINLQRFLSTGLLTALSGAHNRMGFSSNPLSFLYTVKVPYSMQAGLHEVDRNNQLIAHLTDRNVMRPVLYPSATDLTAVEPFKAAYPYVCMAPASVWFTKKLPEKKWIELGRRLCEDYMLYLIGAPADWELCRRIIAEIPAGSARNLCGDLSLLQSAGLMQSAKMNYVNDSAPLHLASSLNAPTTVFFCSTVTDFGFGPLSDKSVVAQIEENLYCRPCGIHGRKQCPEGHFRCGHDIDVQRYLPDK